MDVASFSLDYPQWPSFRPKRKPPLLFLSLIFGFGGGTDYL
jgi:hypothetical protein